MKTRAPQRFIYVIGPLEGAQKVGLTTDPKVRLATLQTGCSQELVIHVAVRVPFAEAHAVERRVHRALERCRVRNEWFDTTSDGAMGAVLAATKSFERVSKPSTSVGLNHHFFEELPLFASVRTSQLPSASSYSTPGNARKLLTDGDEITQNQPSAQLVSLRKSLASCLLEFSFWRR